MSAALTGVPAAATLPSPLWMGVERIVVDCNVASGAGRVTAVMLCDHLLAELPKQTNYPVTLRTDAAGRIPSPAARHELALHVTARPLSRQVRAGSGLQVVLRAERPGLRADQPEASAQVSFRVALSADGTVPDLDQRLSGAIRELLTQRRPSASAPTEQAPSPPRQYR